MTLRFFVQKTARGWILGCESLLTILEIHLGSWSGNWSVRDRRTETLVDRKIANRWVRVCWLIGSWLGRHGLIMMLLYENACRAWSIWKNKTKKNWSFSTFFYPLIDFQITTNLWEKCESNDVDYSLVWSSRATGQKDLSELVLVDANLQVGRLGLWDFRHFLPPVWMAEKFRCRSRHSLPKFSLLLQK